MNTWCFLTYIPVHIANASFWLAVWVYQGAIVLIWSLMEKLEWYCSFCLIYEVLCIVLLGTYHCITAYIYIACHLMGVLIFFGNATGHRHGNLLRPASGNLIYHDLGHLIIHTNCFWAFLGFFWKKRAKIKTISHYGKAATLNCNLLIVKDVHVSPEGP